MNQADLAARIAQLGMEAQQHLNNHHIVLGMKAEAEFLLKSMINEAAKELVAATNPVAAPEVPPAQAESAT